MTKTLRLDVRARNNVLWHAIFDQYKNVAEFCHTHGFSPTLVGAWLNLTDSPYRRRDRQLSPVAIRCAMACEIMPEQLFPPELYAGLFPVRQSVEVAATDLPTVAAAIQFALPPGQEEAVVHRELHDALVQVLQTLTPREEYAVKAFHGIDRESPLTLEEVGQVWGISRERVRQIIARAYRKLRRSARGDRLRPHVEDVLKVGAGQ